MSKILKSDNLESTTISSTKDASLLFSTRPSDVLTTRLIITSSGNVGIGNGVSADSILELYGAGSTSASPSTSASLGATIALQDSAGATGNGGMVMFGASTGFFAAIKGYITNGTSNTVGDLLFCTRNAVGDATLTERLRITAAGGISFGSGGANYGTANYVLQSNGNAVPTWVLLDKDNIAALAGIEYSKLNLTTSIVNNDISASAAIVYSKLSLGTSIVNSDISATAAIVDTKLATISTALKVSNSATTATSANTASTIVARDASGNFTAGTITATTFSGALSGNASTATSATSATSATTATTANALATANTYQVNGLGVGTAPSATAGEIRATNNVTAFYSDERLKNFIGKISNALDKVNSLNGYYFTENSKAKEFGYNNDSIQVGVSAQEVEKILPEIVTLAPIDCATDSAGKTISKTGQNYKTVYYEKLIPLLIEAIKELSSEVNKLKK